MDEDIQEWVSVSHSPGKTFVRVSLKRGNASAKWTVKVSTLPAGQIKAGVVEARAAATAALIEVEEAMA